MSKWMDFTRRTGLNRANQVLTGLLVLQLVLAVVVLWPKATPVSAGAPLFPGLDVTQVVRVTITDNTGEQITLAKELGNWVLPDADQYPCDEAKVSTLLDQVAGLTSDRLVAQTRASHERLGVDERDYEILLEMEMAGGEVLDLYIGTSPSYQTSHVRQGDQEQVYLVSGLSSSTVSARPSMWIDTAYFSLSRDEMVGLTLQNANGVFEFSKGEDDSWTMNDLAADEVLNENTVTSMISGFSALRMLRPLGKEELDAYGMQEPAATIRLYLPDEGGTSKAYVLRVGAYYEEDNAYVLKAATSSYYVLVSEYTANLWINKTRDDFLQEPPTPTPEAGS